MDSTHVAIIAAAGLLLVCCTIHTVDEGHVGVYYRNGRILDYTVGPGLHFHAIPGIDRVRSIQVTMQTDQITNVPCGTQGGTMISFARIEVVNQLHPDHVLATVRNFTADYDRPLIFDKIHHELNQFCSIHTLRQVYIDKFDQIDENLKAALQTGLQTLAPGITISAVRVTKPQIPADIAANFEQVEAQKAMLLIETERQKVTVKAAETERLRATIEARKQAEVANISAGMARMAADARLYEAAREAEGNQLKLTPEYLHLQGVRAVANNTKIFFGNELPAYLATPFVVPY